MMKLSDLFKVLADSCFMEITKGYIEIYKGYTPTDEDYIEQKLHAHQLRVSRVCVNNRRLLIITQPMEE